MFEAQVSTIENVSNFNLISDKPEDKIDIIDKYLRAVRMLRDYRDEKQDPVYSQVRNRLFPLIETNYCVIVRLNDIR